MPPIPPFRGTISTTIERNHTGCDFSSWKVKGFQGKISCHLGGGQHPGWGGMDPTFPCLKESVIII